MLKKIFLCVILISLIILEKGLAENISSHIKCPISLSKSQPVETNISNEIKYDFNFEAKTEDEKFKPGLLYVKEATTKRDIVLVNSHDDAPLNTESRYKTGHRTLSWGTPYEAATQQAMSAIHHPHEQSALLTAWSKNKFRTYISFIIIPKGTKMEFKIGHAAPQAHTGSGNIGKEAEQREGGGVQMRLRYLPKNSTVLTIQATDGSKTTYSLVCLLNKAAAKSVKENKIFPNVVNLEFAFPEIKGYLEEAFENIQYDQLAAN